ncbi:MAG TPA: FtsX-like permease family protein [Ktedonobacterales bacterium]
MRLDEASQRTQPRVAAVRPGASGGQGSRGPWRAGRASVFSAARLALARLSHGRALLAAVGLGMLVAVTLICAVPLFNALIIDTQLQRAINTGDPIDRNIQISANSYVSEAARQDAQSIAPRLASQYLSEFTDAKPTVFAVSDGLILRSAGENVYDPLKSPQVKLESWDYSRATPHMTFLSGGTPRDTSGATIQVIVTAEFATDTNLRLGSHITVWQYGAHQNQVLGVVVGIWRPSDPSDPFWNDNSFNAGGSLTAPKIYPVLVSQDAFYRALDPMPDLGLSQNWIYYTDPAAINSSNMDRYLRDITQFRSQLSGGLQATSTITGVGVITRLDSIISGLNGQQSLLALPLYMVVSQVVGLALLFVFAMAGLLIEGQSQEIATLKSRGASGIQLLGVFITQGVILGLCSAVLGAALAAPLAIELVKTFVPASTLGSLLVSPTYLARLASPSNVALPAAIGALLGLGAILISALQVTRMDVLAFRREQGRRSRQPFWARYYLDLIVVALCAIGYLELGQFGSASIRAQLPGGSSSPLLLITPTLLLLGGSLLVLRIAPWAASLGERLASRGRGLSAMLAFAQVERTPAKYMRMTLLLTLAVGLGIFAISFDASLQQNIRDTAAYSAGADLRVGQNFPEPAAIESRIVAAYQSQPGVRGVAPVYRTIASTTPDQGSESLGLLAIDPASFSPVVSGVSWRSDYASTTLDALMSGLTSHSFPTSGAGTPIWTLVSQSYADQYALKVGDHFSLALDESFFGSTSFQVGAIVNDFPTMYPNQYPAGFVVINIADFTHALTAANANPSQPVGPNEFWLRLDENAAHERALQTYLAQQSGLLDDKSSVSLRDTLSAANANPVSSGMRGLLLVGAIMAALLAILGAVVQSGLAARQRATQFAVLRTLGVSNGQLIKTLLSEQAVVYLFGLVGGTALGALLVTATLPYLQFSDRPVDPTLLGTPPYVLITDPGHLALFYGALVAAFVVALTIAARYAATVGLGNALRLGED